MKISRTLNIICFFTYILSILCFLAAVLFVRTGGLRLLLALPFLPATLWYISRTRCPHCRRFGLRVMPFAPNAGHCNYCGELTEYSD